MVVEFYATWCEPCMDAIPRWKKLHDKYRGVALRLHLVGWLPKEERDSLFDRVDALRPYVAINDR